MTHTYGRVPDKRDVRDHVYRAIRRAEYLPPSVDLRPLCSPVRDQGALGSCTAFSMGSGLREYLLNKNPIPPNPNPDPDPEPEPTPEPTFWERFIAFLQWLISWLFGTKPVLKETGFVPLSPLFLYYEERVLEGTVGYDSGAEMRDGMKVLQQTGICPESDWPYVVSKFTQKPPASAYANAGNYKINSYSRLYTLDDIKSALANEEAVVLGFTVYESFESIGSDGRMPMPSSREQILGGHAVFVAGYKDDPSYEGGGYLIIKNSWGTDWGLNGYFLMPYEYVNYDVSMDIWTGA